jgi:hypothetical protein
MTESSVMDAVSQEKAPSGASLSAVQGPKSHRFAWAWILSAVVVIAGVVVIIVGLHGPRVGPSLPAPVGSVPATTSSISTSAVAGTDSVFAAKSTSVTATLASDVVTPAKAGAPKVSHATAIARSAPVHLVIPALGISVPVSQLGLNTNGSVVAPTSYTVPGWYKDGYAPGQLGSAVILGHIDSSGVFSKIVDLKVGEHLSVTLADHTSLTYKVIGVREYPAASYPYKGVYGPEKYSALNLVSVGSIFNAPTGHSVSDVVVFTALVGS